MSIVVENKQIESRDKPVCGVPGDQINLLLFQSAGEEAQIHDARRLGKAQAISCSQSFVAVWPFHEFVAEPCSPMRSISGYLRDGFQVKTLGIFAADFNGERIVESKRRA